MHTMQLRHERWKSVRRVRPRTSTSSTYRGEALDMALQLLAGCAAFDRGARVEQDAHAAAQLLRHRTKTCPDT